jgi:O-antigen ligase
MSTQTSSLPAGSAIALARSDPARPVAARPGRARRSHAVVLLQIFAVTLMVFPSDTVIKAVGGAGYVAALVSYVIFLCWAVATMFGLHNPLKHRSPVRIALCVFWLATLASYIVANQGAFTTTQQLGAARWIMQLLGASGIILVASECLTTLGQIKRVLRAMVWGGAFCGVVAALQYWLRYDITPYLREIPGFSANSAVGYVGIGSRGSLNRVAGTAISPIELGVVAGMLLPLAAYLAIHDTGRPGWQRYGPMLGIALAVPTSVSRSAILAAGIALGVFVVCLPARRRISAIAGVMVAVAGIFVAAHGLIGTLDHFFFAGTSDASIAHRVNNYPYVEMLVRKSPWLGQGGGTYAGRAGFTNLSQAHILDNQYLTTEVEMGAIGLAALVFFFLWPVFTAMVARQGTSDPELRDLCAALLGAGLAAAVCSATFDSLSFPMFINELALVTGLTGATWLLVTRQPTPAVEPTQVSGRVPDIDQPDGARMAAGSGGI